MPEVSLSKALKLKNRQIKTVRALRDRILAHNRRVEGADTAFDIPAEYTRLLEETGKLAAIKCAITSANGAIQDSINRIAELRGHLAFLDTVPTMEGPEPNYGMSAPTRYTAQLKAGWMAEEKERLQNELDELQDRIDEYNASVKVLLPD
ncbi:MAG: hypothetical protein MH204_01140 [Fimbriimonadaceae bacterium]|nr:hypothetical protein [Fimbriimonadaceae bacterium]